MNDGVNSAKVGFVCPSHYFAKTLRDRLLKLGYSAKKSGKSVIIINPDEEKLNKDVIVLTHYIKEEMGNE